MTRLTPLSGRRESAGGAAGARPEPVRAGLRAVLTVAVAGVLATGCASTPQFGSQVSPAEIPELEERASESPSAVPVLVRLGRAYRAAERPDDAIATLERAVGLDPTHPAAVAYLGRAYEEADRPADARALYESYREAGDADELLRWIDGRIPILRRQELVLEVRDALAREEELAATEPRARHVAVFPFRFAGGDPEFEPLSRAMAELLVTDLSQTDRLTVLERMRVQLLLDELALAETGRVDPATAARSGRLLGAEHAVLGTLATSEDEVMLEAALVGVAEAVRGPDAVSERDALRDLFDAEKRLALGLYQGLGIELTAAERERILEHRTESLEALLAFGRGLAAEDRGDFAAAAVEYRRAAQIDPDFQAAQARAEETEVAAQAGPEPPAEAVGEVAAAPTDPGAALDELDTLIPDPAVRDAVAEASGQEGISRAAILEILIRRP